mmetsp:Transcript_85064/g.275444  ORF Transcript_85064/g.275444 Transcript_85064/m.275444 type:complete len:102 (-) Transcript_85064:129-434(-)
MLSPTLLAEQASLVLQQTCQRLMDSQFRATTVPLQELASIGCGMCFSEEKQWLPILGDVSQYGTTLCFGQQTLRCRQHRRSHIHEVCTHRFQTWTCCTSEW